MSGSGYDIEIDGSSDSKVMRKGGYGDAARSSRDVCRTIAKERRRAATVAGADGSWKITMENKGRKRTATTSEWSNDRGGTLTVGQERQHKRLDEPQSMTVEEDAGEMKSLRKKR
ncbi:hypothetical protein B296_00030586 [Ensete ventricosum]|uniref:Uncharacterized protein n=1 Tax=Ensete ventricosum TaxID=4639 RepID=A0A426YCK7_ENSVE|nr:hypothetical protein B296_00030586 [Ensete ventricosum]